MIRKIFLLGLCLVLIGTSPVSAAEEKAEKEKKPAVEKKGFGISIAPSVVRMTGKPGQAQNATVRVLNNGAGPTQVVTEVSDVGNRVDEQGRLVREFPPAGTLPYSCAKWTLLRENQFALQPTEFKDVTFVISPPSDSVGGSACVVFFRGIPLTDIEKSGDSSQPRATIQIQPRLGAMVFYEIEGTVKRTAQLLKLTSEAPTAKDPLRLHYAFKNTGNSDVLLSWTFYILDANKTLMAKGDLKSIRMFPGDEGLGETEWPSTLGPGKYQLVVSFELGPEAREVIVKELEFSVP